MGIRNYLLEFLRNLFYSVTADANNVRFKRNRIPSINSIGQNVPD